MTEPVAVEPGVDEPVVTEPVRPGAAASARSVRWPVAFLVTVLALGGLAAGVSVLSGRAIPEARRWIPASAAVVVELRPDLPGDQRDGLGALLAHFPGFRDRSLLDRKLDETAEQLVGQVTGGAVSYLRDVKPWLAGPLAIALIPAAAGEAPDWLIVATTDGTVGPSDLQDLPAHDEALEAVTVTLVERMALIGTEGAVGLARTARDAGAGIDTDPAYAAALEALGGDRLISVVARPAAVFAAMPIGDMAYGLPAWVAAGLRAESDALIADLVAAPVDLDALGPGGALLESGPARLADRVPAGSIAFLEVHPVGLAAALMPTGSPGGVDSAPINLGTMLRTSIGLIEDAAFVVLAMEAADGPTAAFLLRAADPASATNGAALLRNLLAFAAETSGGQVDVSVHDGTEIAAADVGPALAGLLERLVPNGAGAALDGRRLAVAVDGDTVLVGLGEASVRSLLDVGGGASLADTERFRSALEAVGGTGGAIGYLDLENLIGALVADLPASDAERWATDLAPFAAPLRALVFTLDADPDAPRFRIVLTVE